jgi:hypothetical protein
MINYGKTSLAYVIMRDSVLAVLLQSQLSGLNVVRIIVKNKPFLFATVTIWFALLFGRVLPVLFVVLVLTRDSHCVSVLGLGLIIGFSIRVSVSLSVIGPILR